MVDIVVHGASELVVGPAGEKSTAKRELETYEDGAVAIENGIVTAVGPTESVCREYPPHATNRAIDAAGRTVIPGFVDPHTHALFAGDRSEEFVARVQGKSYTEIMAAGGGIAVTVESVREASEKQLRSNLERQLDVMLAHGTTTAEVKSGYGLDTETELRMLSIIQEVDESHPVDLVGTFMGAHAVPEGTTTDEYVDSVVEDQLPAVANQGIAEFCDVFCEEGVFSVDQSRRILAAGQEHGLGTKVHAEEFERIGGAKLAAELGAVSADHLLAATAADADALRSADVVATFLPATALSLREEYADPTPFLDGPVALGSDLNPSCFVHSMGTVTSLACLGMGLHPDRAILGATADAGRALARPAGVGTLREGTSADLAIVDLPSATHIPYNAGTNRVETVCADGQVVIDGGKRRSGGDGT